MPGFAIQGHGEIAAAARRPTRHCLSRGAIDDDDGLVSRIVDENAARASIELKAFGMRLELDVGDLASAGWIDDRQCTIAIRHKHAIADRIRAHVIGILAQRDPRDRSIIIPAENCSRSIAAVGDVQAIRRRMVAKALRLAQTRNDLHDLVGVEVDDRHRVVFELGDKQAIAREIDRQVVDAAANFAQRDFSFQ